MFLENIDTLIKDLKPGSKAGITNLVGGSLALALASIATCHSGVLIVLLPDPRVLQSLEEELAFFLAAHKHEIPVLSFPAWETLPYDVFSPHQDIISTRLQTLYKLPTLTRGVLLLPVSTLMNRLCPPDYLFKQALILEKGQPLDLKGIQGQLSRYAYQNVPQVMEHGEFACRGSILDLFPMGSPYPVRIDCVDEAIDSIRTFDVETQRSLKVVHHFQCLPAREYPLHPEGIKVFRSQFRESFEGDPSNCSLYVDVSEGHASPGLEYYLPLFFEKTSSLLDYLPAGCLIAGVDDIVGQAEDYWTHIQTRFEHYRHDRRRPLLSPQRAFFQANELFQSLKQFNYLSLQTDSSAQKNAVKAIVEELPPLTIEKNYSLSLLSDFLKNFSGSVLFTVETVGRKEVLKERLQSIHCYPIDTPSWEAFLKGNDPIGIVVAPLGAGFILKDFALISEFDFVSKIVRGSLTKTPKALREASFQDLGELKVGTAIVHIDHGIGRYGGLVRLTVAGQENEFMLLDYAGSDKLYVPVSSLHLISRYSSTHAETVMLAKLGTDQWQRTKTKVIDQAHDVAAELLAIYARRATKIGLRLADPDEQYQAFSEAFPFEKTPDQQRAIESIITDLTSGKPMDRVICGDVGFGKTEVALRAAFLAVQSGKQVAVLVPTTLLAEQHFQTFCDRFSAFPIRIEVLSRFKNKSEQAAIFEKMQKGAIDILIGTHSILNANLHFEALGLVIIDEEHRFGVKQKEAFKALRSEVHVLTLTATPIPRTLNMAMSSLRDLSIIATPPAKRLSIKTFVREKNTALIQEAMLRELHRGGQIYYLHNAVDSIEREAKWLETLVPSARIVIAHGQMRETLLERVMSDFYHRKFNVLVCTTIIETGIDIPTANTMIIDRADKLGLAQLHQLRGRVGRSHHQAYAFCLIPGKKLISADAIKRLEALENMDELGAGFTLATHDLEIRGAGELLGDSQSGNIQAIGFHLYLSLLEQTVQSLKEGKTLDLDHAFKQKTVEIDLQLSVIIPEKYVPDVHSRLLLYRRIANAGTCEDLDALRIELIDRFGSLPVQTAQLFQISALSLAAESLKIAKITASAQGGYFEFSHHTQVDPRHIIDLLQQSKECYTLQGPQRLRFKKDLSDPTLRINFVKDLLDRLGV